MNTNTPFKWVFTEIKTSISSKILTKGTTFANYILVVDAYYRNPGLYGMENITTELSWTSYICFRQYLKK